MDRKIYKPEFLGQAVQEGGATGQVGVYTAYVQFWAGSLSQSGRASSDPAGCLVETAGPGHLRCVLHAEVHTLRFHRKLHAIHRPWRNDTQKLLI